ncbi:hypothetical protein AB2F98_01610 [Escherichia coli]
MRRLAAGDVVEVGSTENTADDTDALRQQLE